jgi:RNA polymerase sigma-32 factor
MSRTRKKNSKKKVKPGEKTEQTMESLVEPKSEELSPQQLPSESLAKLDPLRKYLLEIGRFEPLTAEEEERLAVLYREQDDQEAAYRLITSNLRVVVQIARLYNRVYTNIMDLVQEGNIGLMEAVKRFDPYQGARLPTYASWWIKAYIIKFILDNFRIVRVGTTNERRKLLFNLRKEKEKLRLQGIEPTPDLIAKRLNVRPEEVVAVEQAIESSDVSLSTYVDDNQSIQYVDTLRATEDSVDETLARKELKQLFNREIEEFSRALTERETVILRERLIAETPRTLQDIADQFEVSREAIRLTEKALVTKIKEHMQETFKNVTDIELALN